MKCLKCNAQFTHRAHSHSDQTHFKDCAQLTEPHSTAHVYTVVSTTGSYASVINSLCLQKNYVKNKTQDLLQDFFFLEENYAETYFRVRDHCVRPPLESSEDLRAGSWSQRPIPSLNDHSPTGSFKACCSPFTTTVYSTQRE